MITHTLTWAVSSNTGSQSITGTQGETGNSEIPIVQSFPAGSSGATVSGVAFTTTGLQSIFLLADKSCSITFTGPGVTIPLVGGTPFVWDRSPGYFANPFSGANVTGATLTCTPGVNLKGKILNT